MTTQAIFRLIAGVFGLVVFVPVFIIMFFEFYRRFLSDYNFYKNTMEQKRENKSREEIKAIQKFKKDMIKFLGAGLVTFIVFCVCIGIFVYLVLNGVGIIK